MWAVAVAARLSRDTSQAGRREGHPSGGDGGGHQIHGREEGSDADREPSPRVDPAPADLRARRRAGVMRSDEV
eukprot:3601688-Prymnesium_polylepis.1